MAAPLLTSFLQGSWRGSLETLNLEVQRLVAARSVFDVNEVPVARDRRRNIRRTVPGHWQERPCCGDRARRRRLRRPGRAGRAQSSPGLEEPAAAGGRGNLRDRGALRARFPKEHSLGGHVPPLERDADIVAEQGLGQVGVRCRVGERPRAGAAVRVVHRCSLYVHKSTRDAR